MNAVETLGADKAVPSKILEHMGPIAVGLTRQNVASHLQKYRTRKRTQNDFCKAAAYCPPAAYQCWSPFSPPCAMIGAPLSPSAALHSFMSTSQAMLYVVWATSICEVFTYSGVSPSACLLAVS